MSLYLGKNLISGQTTLVGESRNIGQIIPSTIPLTDAGLHLLDGALIQGSGIYSAFVDYIAGLVSTYPDLFITESDWQTSVTTYGVCGKFVYDSVNNTVRLPKITGILEGTTDLTALGDLVEAGLPNITGTMTSSGWKLGRPALTGAFYREDTEGDRPSYGTSGGSDWYFDASRSNPIYGNSTTVQPQTIKAFYYIVIATSTKTDIQVDIDEIATDLNGKADVDLNNTSPSASFKSNSVSWCMPDYENQITGSGRSWVQCAKDSFICIWGADSYKEDYKAQISPDNGTTTYIVGVRADDYDSSTQQTSFTFLCPKNWYFRCTAENWVQYRIYPLKGAN